MFLMKCYVFLSYSIGWIASPFFMDFRSRFKRVCMGSFSLYVSF